MQLILGALQLEMPYVAVKTSAAIVKEIISLGLI